MPEEGRFSGVLRGYRADMGTRTETAERSSLATVLGALAALGLVRAAGRLYGFLALLGIVIGCVAALTVGILLLRVVLLH